MGCTNHPENVAVATCTVCEKQYCRECIPEGQEVCAGCLLAEIEYYKSTKKSRITSLIVGLVLGVVLIIAGLITYGFEEFYGILDFLSFFLGGFWMGLMLANIHVGWKALSKFTSNFFAIFSIPGWALYFFLKFCAALFIGWAANPISILIYNSKIKRLTELATNTYGLYVE